MLIWGRVRAGTGSRFVQLQRKSGGGFTNVGGRITTNGLGYFSVKKGAGSYRFEAYGTQTGSTGSASGSAAELLGTSRLAVPKVLPSR